VIVVEKNKILNFKDPPDGWKDQIANALITAGFNFFSTLAGLGATNLTQDPLTALATAGVSAGVGFFASLMLQRGLKKPEA
jgi:hypothetical protein